MKKARETRVPLLQRALIDSPVYFSPISQMLQVRQSSPGGV